MLQMDVGTTLAAALYPFHLQPVDAAEFLTPHVGREFPNFTSRILELDAAMEERRGGFDRHLPFYAPRYKNHSETLSFLYQLAQEHSDNITRRVMEGTLLLRGIDVIEMMVAEIVNVDSRLAAVYLYMVASSEMLGYAIRRQNQGDISRGQASLGCVYAVLRNYHSAFLHWAARFLQSRYSVDAAQKIRAKILNEFLAQAPANVVEDFRVLHGPPLIGRDDKAQKSMHPHATADPTEETYSRQAKVDEPYTPDNFLRNLVLHARSASKAGVHWTPFQKITKLEVTTRLVHAKKLYVVPPPMYLTEDFFYADAFETSLNLATLGAYVAGVIMSSIDTFSTPAVRQWKKQFRECQRTNLRALGWLAAVKDEADLDYDAEVRLSVAYGAALQDDKAFTPERSRFFFQRFALAHCALNATTALKMSIQYAVFRMPHFPITFNCKPPKFVAHCG
ncbi:hypothetical protein HPB51_012573 [Rhipicephalus microplus]|uniref:Uncharacterized protein n=1 Tax=Rhipicephalus microplus TaxID=6941 RepID=A0A9J6DGS8_RHIMP|nr:hypothetical protein HPB51_012573 [Rhipicephalus microplus]